MRTMTGYTVAAFCVVTFLGVALVACDNADSSTNQASTQEASAQAETVSDRPVARYDEGELTLLVSTDEARETVMKAAHNLIPNVEDVTFEEPSLEMVGNAPILMMRGMRPDGNCALAYVQLASEEVLAAGAAPSISETQAFEGRSVELYAGRDMQACNGVNCEHCTVPSGGGCSCARVGDPGETGYCNHSCDPC